jgi:hypothetical protein
LGLAHIQPWTIMQHAEKMLKPVADTAQRPADAEHAASATGMHNSPRVAAQRQPLHRLFGEASQLQAVIGRSPRMLTQRRALDAAFGGAIQREADGLEDEDLLQARMASVAQRAEIEEDEELPLQARMADGVGQRVVEDEDDEALLQGRFEGAAVQRVEESAESGDLSAAAPTATAAPLNDTGMPNQLKAGIESLSGMDMSDVRVHRNSDKPAQLSALAYAQGNDIHLGPGQEQHLPHEVWHVVQQRQGRVRETVQMAGVGVRRLHIGRG